MTTLGLYKAGPEENKLSQNQCGSYSVIISFIHCVLYCEKNVVVNISKLIHSSGTKGGKLLWGKQNG